ncbi:phosphatidylinositol transfer protein CSR1-like isoform X2 [Tripterygium wilfordii]|uniref:phosphatidylinositol transfer protein CSR1-like isoform X2 n=1 Tax=Tripterygium wilfordii TaxID=458696 RepID=UPI0018F8430C|nr:phosphatidylinositol transfer protein CSR1-like isoform X2 [Tripterygium wilfordii]
MAVRMYPALGRSVLIPVTTMRCPIRNCKFSVQNCVLDPNKSRKLVLEVKEKLVKDYHSLPLGKNGRDDEDMIYWFLKDRKFSVEDATAKLAKAIKWRHEFGVSTLSQESVKNVAETGKAFVHDFLDVNGRPVLVVMASKHFPAVHDPVENEKLCVFLIEKAMSKLPAGKEEILGIFDLRGFGIENADLKFITFMFDVFYYYYPKRLGDVLFVEAPFIFKPIWQLAKPLLKSYASLVAV